MQESKPKTTTRRDVNAAQRAALALHLRAQRMKLDDIASQCGYASAGAAYNAIQRELQRVVVESVEELRTVESLSLDQLETECWKLFEEADDRTRLSAADRILAVKKRRAELLGLDTPVNNNIALAQVVVREVPTGYLEEPKS